jgi:hypothetical protein
VALSQIGNSFHIVKVSGTIDEPTTRMVAVDSADSERASSQIAVTFDEAACKRHEAIEKAGEDADADADEDADADADEDADGHAETRADGDTDTGADGGADGGVGSATEGADGSADWRPAAALSKPWEQWVVEYLDVFCRGLPKGKQHFVTIAVMAGASMSPEPGWTEGVLARVEELLHWDIHVEFSCVGVDALPGSLRELCQATARGHMNYGVTVHGWSPPPPILCNGLFTC